LVAEGLLLAVLAVSVMRSIDRITAHALSLALHGQEFFVEAAPPVSLHEAFGDLPADALDVRY
jgi:hypothetical protein